MANKFVGDDIMTFINRCAWYLSNPLYITYHDEEWERVVRDDRMLFACLCLEGMQAGLSWITILKRREHYNEAFDGFDSTLIANKKGWF